jgi:hypothetical protein
VLVQMSSSGNSMYVRLLGGTVGGGAGKWGNLEDRTRKLTKTGSSLTPRIGVTVEWSTVTFSSPLTIAVATLAIGSVRQQNSLLEREWSRQLWISTKFRGSWGERSKKAWLVWSWMPSIASFMVDWFGCKKRWTKMTPKLSQECDHEWYYHTCFYVLSIL